MTEFRVRWEIDVDADDPRAAAREAQRMQQMDREDYWCGAFTVVEPSGVAHHVDLDEPELECGRCGEDGATLNAQNANDETVQVCAECKSILNTYGWHEIGETV